METVKMINEISKMIEIKIGKLKSLKSLNSNILGTKSSKYQYQNLDEYYDYELNCLNELRKLNDNFKDKLLDK